VRAQDLKLPPRAECGEAFGQWLRSVAPQCGLGEKFEFVWNLAEGAGVVATRDLAAKELVMVIPRQASLSVETAFAAEGYGKLLREDRLVRSIPSLALVVLLAVERRNSKSVWKPYLDVLPRAFDLPMLFSAAELEWFQASPVAGQALRLAASAIRHYAYLYRLMSKAGQPTFTFDDFQWAECVVMSRQNRIPALSGAGDGVLALIPGWDMCNYGAGRISTMYNPAAHASEFFAMDATPKGTQVRVFYGERPNSQLALYQGFVAQDNAHDVLVVPVVLDEADALYKLRKLLLGKRGFSTPSQDFAISCTGELSRALRDYCRLACVDKADAEFVLKNADAEIVSPRNEIAALELLIRVLQAVAEAYPTTLEQDEALLASKEGAALTPRQRLAVLMRMAEKRLLRTNVLVCRKEIDTLRVQ
jgi:histone-lysine N-methyltransferase SETD3